VPRDPFEILGLPGNACEREIKKSYRILSKLFHPDLNSDPEAEARFRDIQWAYEALSGEQSQKDDSDSTAAHGTKNSSDPADWSEKPFGGFFRAMRAYAERSRSRNSQKVACTTEGSSRDGRG
jgi:DnaJ-class molecular chaperone